MLNQCVFRRMLHCIALFCSVLQCVVVCVLKLADTVTLPHKRLSRARPHRAKSLRLCNKQSLSLSLSLSLLSVTLSICLGFSLGPYAGGRMDFTRGNLKPKSANSILQALSCRFCQLQLNNPSKLVISKKMEIKDRFTCTQCLEAFSRWVVASKVRALGAAGNAPDPVRTNPGGFF